MKKLLQSEHLMDMSSGEATKKNMANPNQNMALQEEDTCHNILLMA